MKRLAALAALAALALPVTASAATGSAVFGLRPLGHPKLGYFVYRLAAGGAQTGAVLVTNTGTAAGTVRLYPADGSTGSTSGAIYLTDVKPKATGAWIHLSARSVRLAPRTARRITFTVRVPAHQRPGEWVAGLVAESVTPTKAKKPGSKTGIQVNVRDQTIIAVQVDVPGPLAAKFAVGNVTTAGQHGYQDVVVHFANTGNALAKPTGKVTVSQGAKVVASLPFAMDTFLPQTAIDYPILLKKALGAGSYTALVRLSYTGAGGRRQTLSESRRFTISQSDVAQVFTSAAPTQKPPTAAAPSASSGSSTPWGLIAAIAAAVVVLLALVWLLVRRRRLAAAPGRRRQPPAAAIERTAPPSPPADPGAIAELPPRVEPEPAPPPQPAPATEPSAPGGHRHYWEVAYDRGKLDADGVWRFPHRCRECGVEVLAENIEDASAQAAHQSG
jgi:hypothetical protein